MPENRQTRAHGAKGSRRFPTTRWSMVLAAGADRSARSRAALAELCESYWYPLYAYLRRKGHGTEEARDLVQGFVLRLIEKKPFPSLRPERGRFRSYLIAALKHHEVNEWKRERALKRGGGQVALDLDLEEGERRYALEPVERETAETLYERRWATALLGRALGRLRRDYEAAGKSEIIRRLEGTLAGELEPPDYRGAARELGMTEGAVKVAAHRLRRRYREALRREVADTVTTPEEVEDELRHLFGVLGR